MQIQIETHILENLYSFPTDSNFTLSYCNDTVVKTIGMPYNEYHESERTRQEMQKQYLDSIATEQIETKGRENALYHSSDQRW